MSFHKFYYYPEYSTIMNKTALMEELGRHREKAEEAASQKLAKPRKEARNKHIKNLKRAIDFMLRDSEEFKVSGFNEKSASVQEKYSQRMYESLMEILKKVQEPETITLKSLERYLESFDLLVEEMNEVFKKYVKLLDRSFTAKVKALDKSFRHLFKEKEKLRKFLDKKYRPSSMIEGSIWEIDDILPLVEAYYNELDKITSLENDVMSKTKQMEEKEAEIQALESHEFKAEFERAHKIFLDYQRKFDDQLSDIRKALRKYINKKSKEKNSGDLSFMKEFVTDSATTLATASSLSGINSLLREIKELLETNKLELKKERKESALKRIDALLSGELEEIYKIAKDSYQKREENRRKLEELELEKKISKVRQVYEGLKRDRLRIIEREFREAFKIKNEIEKNIEQLAKKHSIVISTKLDPIPTLGLDISTVIHT